MQQKMSGASLDRRVEKTKSAIASALFRLIAARDWHDINVSALCQEANVARSTFYLHYDSPAAVLDQMIGEIVKGLTANDSSKIAVLDWLVDHIAENRAVFHRTVSASQTNFVIDRFKAGMMAAFSHQNDEGGKRSATFQTAMIIGGAFEAIQLWAKRWDRAEIPELKSEIRRLEMFVCPPPKQQ